MVKNMFKNTQKLRNLYFYRKCWLETMIFCLNKYSETDDSSFYEWAKTFGEYSKRDKEEIEKLSTVKS